VCYIWNSKENISELRGELVVSTPEDAEADSNEKLEIVLNTKGNISELSVNLGEFTLEDAGAD
jgi:hypothetical protein